MCPENCCHIKVALKAKVKALDFGVTSQKDGDSTSLYITLMSPEQLAATKLPGGITTDKIEALSKTNPLTALENGEDDSTPGKPQPHLQKALARSILFSGQTYMDILPYIAGKEDMRRLVGKSLTELKEKFKDNPEMIKKIDTFLADPVFKDQRQWGKPIEQQDDIPQTPNIGKVIGDISDTSKPYEPGVMTVNVRIPASKFPEIREKLAALEGPAAATPAAAPQGNVQQEVATQLKPVVDVMTQVIQNQKQLAEAFIEHAKMNQQAPQQVAPSQVTYTAATAPGPVAPTADEALANAILAQSQPTGWADRISQAPTAQPVRGA